MQTDGYQTITAAGSVQHSQLLTGIRRREPTYPTRDLEATVSTVELPTTVSPLPTRRLSLCQWILTIIAGLSSAVAIGWPTFDYLYGEQFSTPAAWWLSVFVAIVSWGVWVNRLGQERIIRDNQAIMANQFLMNQYHADLAERLDTYGDKREAQAHARLSAAIRGSNGRPLHLVD